MKDSRFNWQTLICCLTGLVCPTLVGCSAVVDVEAPQCSNDSDCLKRGAAFAGSVCVRSTCQPDPRWACAGQTSAVTAQTAIQAPLSIVNIFDFSPLAGIRVSVCAKLDLMCMKPLGHAESDATGTALINLPDGFDGYFQLDSDAIEPMLYFRHYPVNDGEPVGYAALSPKGALQSLATQLGETALPDRGLAVVRVVDCLQQPAAGLTAEFVGDMSGTRPYYTANGQISSVAQSTDSTTAIVGVLNANRGTLGLNFTLGGRSIVQTEIMVRQGYLSYQDVQVGQ